MNDDEKKKDETKDDNVPRIGKGGEDQKKEPTQKLNPNAPPTHFAIRANVATALLKLLGKLPHKKVRHLIQGIEDGTPLVLGPSLENTK